VAVKSGIIYFATPKDIRLTVFEEKKKEKKILVLMHDFVARNRVKL
jgi:hypothetical protein